MPRQQIQVLSEDYSQLLAKKNLGSQNLMISIINTFTGEVLLGSEKNSTSDANMGLPNSVISKELEPYLENGIKKVCSFFTGW